MAQYDERTLQRLEWEAEISELEQALAEQRADYAYRTGPDYDPTENADHDEYHDQDIEALEREIAENERRLAYVRQKLERRIQVDQRRTQA